MNDNPGETPNPLNQTSGSSPSPSGQGNATDTNQNVAANSNQNVAPAGNEIVNSLDPSGRPMEKIPDAVPEPPKKSKKGLIATIIIVAVIALCGIIAGIVVALNLGGNDDPVAAAMTKLMSGNGPSNVAIDGTIDFLPKATNSPIKRITVTLDSALKLSSGINNSTAALTVVTSDNKEVSLEFDETYVESGDIYLKVDGATAALEDSGLMELLSGYYLSQMGICTVEDGGESPCDSSEMVEAMTDGILNIVEGLDGVWIHISTDELGALNGGEKAKSSFSCVTDLVNEIDTNSNSAIELYNKYPFYSSSDKDLTVSKRYNPIHRLIFDEENFANFANAINNTVLSTDLYSCLGWDRNVSITKEDVVEISQYFPEMYVEVDDSRNFTRFYSKSEMDDGAEILVDLSFTYPANVSVTEPAEYEDFSSIIKKIMSGAFVLSDDEDIEEGVIVDE